MQAATMISPLAEYVLARRAELKLSQNQLARLSGLSNAWIGRLETGTLEGEPKLPTLEKLAKGLRIDVDTLIRIARGESPKPTEPRKPTDGMLAVIDDMGNLAYPLTSEERAIVERADRMRMSFDTFLMPGFWNKTPQERRRLFRDLENVMDEMQDLMGENHHA